MTKSKPYPCKKQGYKSKDGIIWYSKIILDREVYKILCSYIQERKRRTITLPLENIVKYCPSNLDNTLFDGKLDGEFGCLSML